MKISVFPEYSLGQSIMSLPSDKQESELCSVTHLLCVTPDLFIFPDPYPKTPANGQNPTLLLLLIRKSDFRSEDSLNQKNLSILSYFFFPPGSAETFSARWGSPAYNFFHVLFHRQWLTRMGIWVIYHSTFIAVFVLCSWIVTVAASVSCCHQITVMFPLSPQAMMNVIFQCLP